MKGLRIKVHGKLFDVAMPQGSCGIITTWHHGQCEVSVSGATDKFFSWYKGILETGDRCTVEFTDIKTPMLPEEVLFSKEEQIQNAKCTYDKLHKELLEKGLIDENE